MDRTAPTPSGVDGSGGEMLGAPRADDAGRGYEAEARGSRRKLPGLKVRSEVYCRATPIAAFDGPFSGPPQLHSA